MRSNDFSRRGRSGRKPIAQMTLPYERLMQLGCHNRLPRLGRLSRDLLSDGIVTATGLLYKGGH